MCQISAQVALAQPSEKGRTSELPWSRPDQPDMQATGIRELLQLYDISIDDLKSIPNSESFDEREAALIARLLYRLAGLEAQELEAWRDPRGDWQQISAEIDENRGGIFHIRGRATHIINISVPKELRDSLEFEAFYLVKFELAEGRAAHVLARHIPQAWLSGDLLPTISAADGLLLQASEDVTRPLLFAAGRVAWYPEKPAPEHGVFDSHVRLAQLGTDIGLFDVLRESNSRELTAADREIFYQMLAAAKGDDTSRRRPAMSRRLDLEKLLVHPEQYQGHRLTFEADAKRITWIQINDQTVRDRFSIDGYYEIDITIPLGDRPVRLSSAKRKDGPIYEFKYPATVCVLRLPAKLEKLIEQRSADPQSTPLLNQHINVDAYFFKIWTYRSKYVATYDPQQMHLSPLFLGTTVEVAQSPPPPPNYVPPIFAGVFVSALAISFFFVWRTHVRDRNARRRLRAKD